MKIGLRVVCAIGLATMQWAAWAAGMGPDDARHLLNRSGFGAAPADILEYAALTRSEAVERLLAGTRSFPQTPLPPSVRESPIVLGRDLTQAERQAYDRDQRLRSDEMRAWWIGEMLSTPSPLTERMTLFWHNHFVSGQQKVKHLALMRDQNLLLRSHATGNFAALLHAVSKDPAMLLYLDAAANRRGKPNENFAREVMELFTLGEGHYGEADIKEAARAFTGWSLDTQRWHFVFRSAQHDAGEKRILGRSGRLDGDDVLDLLLAQDQTARFIVGKLWREFVSPQPDPAEVERLAVLFREQGYAIKPVLRGLLLSQAFWQPEVRGSLIKSPVELVVGSLHTLQGEVPDPLPLTRTLRALGQDLLAPPNVRGWPGQDAWINTTTLLTRKQFLDRIARTEAPAMRPAAPPAPDMGGMLDEQARQRQRIQAAEPLLRADLGSWRDTVQRSGLTPAAVLLSVAPVQAGLGDSARALLQDPAYQVK